MSFRRFNHLNVPEYWERYFTKYPQGMTILESLFEWVSQVDAMVDNQNILSLNVETFRKELDIFVEQFDGNLKEQVENTLQDWQDSGFLDIVIDQALQTEMDNLEIRVNEQLESYKETSNRLGVDIKEFGATADGINDDTAAIQLALDSEFNIFWSEGEYYFKNVTLKKDNKKITFDSNVLLKSDDMTTNNFQIKGEEIGLPISITRNIKQHTSLIGIPLDKLPDFQKGDFIYLEQNDPTGITPADNLRKFASCLLEINGTSEDSLIIKDPIPHNFFTSLNARIVKVKPVDNVSIIGDNTTYTQLNRTDFYDYFTANYTTNLTISGFSFINGGGATVRLYRSNSYHVHDIQHNLPTRIDAGYGYNVVSERGSGYGLIERITANSSRHAVDIANGSHNIVVRDVYGFNTNIIGHGQNTRNILIENCHLYGNGFTVGNNTYTHDHNWRFVGCSATNAQYAFNVARQSTNITFDNCQANNCLGGFLIKGKHIFITNFKGYDVYYRGVNITEASSFIQLTNLYFEGYMQPATGSDIVGLVYADGLSTNIKIDNLVVENINYVNAIHLDNAVNVTISNSTIKESLVENSRSIMCRYSAKNIVILNCQLHRFIYVHTTSEQIILQGCGLFGIYLDIRAEKNVMIANNYGTFTKNPVMVHNGTDYIVQNNIETLI